MHSSSHWNGIDQKNWFTSYPCWSQTNKSFLLLSNKSKHTSLLCSRCTWQKLLTWPYGWFMPLSHKLDTNESKNIIRSLNGTDGAELKQTSYDDFSTKFDGLSFQVRKEKKRIRFTVTKLKKCTYWSFNLSTRQLWLNY